MSDFVEKPILKKLNRGNPDTRITRLEQRTGPRASARVENLGELSGNLDGVTLDNISIATDDNASVQPTDLDFVGVFGDAAGVIFPNYANPINFGSGNSGNLKVGFNTDGDLVGGSGNVIIDEIGINLNSGADLQVNEWSPLGLPFDTGTIIYSSTYDATNNCMFFGGNFLGLGGVSSCNVIRYNFDSQSFSTLTPPSNFIGTILSTVLALASDGTYLYVGTNIINHNMWKVNLSTLAWTDMSADVGNVVRALCIIGTNLYIGGEFSNANGIASADFLVSFDTGAGTYASVTTGTPLNAAIKALATDGTDLYVGGSATDMTGIGSADYLAKLTISGTVWSSITTGTSLTSQVLALAFAGTKLYVGGGQTNMIGIANADYMAVYDSSLGTGDAAWSEFHGGVDGTVRGLAVNSSVLCVAGDFTHVDANGTNIAQTGFALYDFVKTQWDTTIPTFTFSGSPQCYTALLAGDSIVFGGNQTGFYESISTNAFPSYGLTVRWGGLNNVLLNNAADIIQNFNFAKREQGALSGGGVLSASVASNDLTVALTGTNMLARIGDTYYTFNTITFTKLEGTNWANLGGAELKTLNQQLFVYLIFNTTDNAVNLCWSRIPWGRTYADFSGTTTNEKYLVYSGTNAPASTDKVQLIGRFDVTLSGTAAFQWSAPGNVIARPIYETDWLTWTPTYAGWSADPTHTCKYKFAWHELRFSIFPTANGTSNATTATLTLPFTALAAELGALGQVINNGVVAQAGFWQTAAASNVLTLGRGAGAAWTNANGKSVAGIGTLQE